MLTWIVLALAGFGAGVVNAIAGGGSLISFPALLFAGMDARIANATNTAAVFPGSGASVLAYRKLIAQERHRAWVLAWPSLAGGAVGSWLMLHTSERAFNAVVPWLIIFACLLLMAQGQVAAWVARRTGSTPARVPAALFVAQFLISVYGGYFGAGIGILMLAAMAIFIREGMQPANALKVLFATLINGISAVYFVAVGAVRIPEAALMAVASVAGGWVGAHVAQRLPARVMRIVVVSYGLLVAGRLLLRS